MISQALKTLILLFLRQTPELLNWQPEHTHKKTSSPYVTVIISRITDSTNFYTTKFPIRPKVFVLRERDPPEYHLEYHQYNVINFDEHEGEVRCAWRLDSSRVDMHKKKDME